MPAYEEKRTALSRQPQVLVVITLDFCSRTFGASPCNATGTPCYNTWPTCKYTAAYDNAGKNYEFSLHGRPLIEAGVRPYLTDFQELATEIDPERGVAVNARVSLTFRDDENDSDIGIDPYVSSRASVQGSFWKKLFARNTYYPGRTVVIKKGFVGVDKADYVTAFKGIIEKRQGPTQGLLRLVLKDYLKKADAVQVPPQTEGKVTDDPLTAGATTVNLDDASAYDASGWVRIDDEVIKYTGKSGNQLTGCARAEFSTAAAEHSKDTVVQQCAVWEAQNPWDIIDDILQNRVGFAAGDIDAAGAESERDTWLLGYSFTACVTKPKKASELIQEICEQSNSAVWWDADGMQVKFKVTAPPVPGSSPKSVDNVSGIVRGSTKLDPNEDSRVSLLVIHFGKLAPGDDDKPESYRSTILFPDVDKEGTKEYGSRATRVIYSRWLTQETVVRAVGNRLMARYRVPPAKYSFALETKDDDLNAGELVKVTHPDFLDVTGAEEQKTLQVLKKERKGLNRVEYLTMDTQFARKYGVISPSTHTNDWDAAPEAEKEYAFVGDSGNRLGTDNEEGFYII